MAESWVSHRRSLAPVGMVGRGGRGPGRRAVVAALRRALVSITRASSVLIVVTWRLRGGLLVLAAVAGRAAAVRRPLTPHTTHRTRGRATVATRGRRYFTSCIHGPLTC